jgi:hypothetical protein
VHLAAGRRLRAGRYAVLISERTAGGAERVVRASITIR